MSKTQPQLPNVGSEDLEAGLTPELWDELKQTQPKDEIDPAFQATLRSRLDQAARRTAVEHNIKQQSTKEPIHMSLSKFFLGVGTSLVAVALIWYVAGGQQFASPQSTVEVLSGKYAVTDVEANSFGSLSNLNAVSAEGGRGAGGDNATASAGAETAPSTTNLGYGGGGPGYGGGDSKLIAPYPETSYVFKYTGGNLPSLATEQSVFKRNKGTFTNPTGSILGAIKLGLFNLQKLTSPNIENLSISEDREKGYTANINFIEGSVSLYENWRTWRLPERECRDDACYNRYRMKPADMPSDDTVIATANQFLADYSIPASNYGLPIVQNYWRQEYERATDKSTVYIPDIVNVVYPFLVDGKTVFDEGGSPAGLNVSVNVRHNIVSSVYEVTTQQYSKSSYAGFTDEAAILALAEKGGFRNYYGIYPADAKAKKVTVELGTPVVGMMRFWQYTQTDFYGTSEELYVPALIFPVLNKTETGYYRDTILVPLVKEIIDNDPQPPIYPLERSVEPAVAPAQDLPVSN